ncbi:MAG TPA: PsiF family protein [Paraburkholderia sp.]|nr:PsiF family protein [Paraburkholderia sp.]
MKIQSVLAAIVLGGVLAAPVFAQTAAPAAGNANPATNSQQAKMKACNAQATGKKGDDRKAFMKQCLSATGSAPDTSAMTPQERMKACNTQAADKKGDDRKAFMKQCLSTKG